MATAIVSNFGDMSRSFRAESVARAGKRIGFGSLTATRFRAITPLRSNTNLFFCLFNYAGQLNFNVTFNSDRLRRTDVEFLLDSVKNQLLERKIQE